MSRCRVCELLVTSEHERELRVSFRMRCASEALHALTYDIHSQANDRTVFGLLLRRRRRTRNPPDGPERTTRSTPAQIKSRVDFHDNARACSRGLRQRIAHAACDHRQRLTDDAHACSSRRNNRIHLIACGPYKRRSRFQNAICCAP